MTQKHLVQRFVVEAAEAASPLLPQHVALTREDGSPALGELAKLSASATVAQAVAAHNALVDALVAAGLAGTAVTADLASEDAAAPADAPTMENTRDEIARYAAEHGVDLSGSKTKADMLDAIASA